MKDSIEQVSKDPGLDVVKIGQLRRKSLALLLNSLKTLKIHLSRFQ